jgi:hypothetical protein
MAQTEFDEAGHIISRPRPAWRPRAVRIVLGLLLWAGAIMLCAWEIELVKKCN